MNDNLFALFELGLFFILLIINLQLFNTLQFDKLFKRNVQPRQMQLLYFLTVIVFTYLATKAFMNIVELSTTLANL